MLGILIAIGVVIAVISQDLNISLITAGVVLVVILQGLRRIPANPPHKAQVTRFGERIPEEVKDEGWRFFFLFPYFYGFILVKVDQIIFKVVADRVRTPDLANSTVPLILSGRPSGKHLIQYLNSGGEEAVKEKLDGQIQERIREWGMNGGEGPANWRELNKSQLEAVSVLVKKIAPKSMEIIPDYAQEVPTFIWLRYFSQPRPTKNNFLEYEKPWGKNNWKRVEAVIQEIKEKHGDSAFNALKEAVKKRREQVENLRVGTASILIEDLGFLLERLNLGDIDVLGGVGEQAEAKARETEERNAERLELAHVKESVQEFVEMGFSKEAALKVVQSERTVGLDKHSKVPMSIDEKMVTISPETGELLMGLAGLFARKNTDNKGEQS